MPSRPANANNTVTPSTEEFLKIQTTTATGFQEILVDSDKVAIAKQLSSPNADASLKAKLRSDALIASGAQPANNNIRKSAQVVATLINASIKETKYKDGRPSTYYVRVELQADPAALKALTPAGTRTVPVAGSVTLSLIIAVGRDPKDDVSNGTRRVVIDPTRVGSGKKVGQVAVVNFSIPASAANASYTVSYSGETIANAVAPNLYYLGPATVRINSTGND